MCRSCLPFSTIAIVHHDFFPQGIMVNKERPIAQSNMSETYRMIEKQSWILQHDSAPITHRCLYVSFWQKKKSVIIPQPPYSLDLAFADFFLFPKLESPMKGKGFATIEEIKEKSKQKLLAIPKSAFQKRFEVWKKILA